MEIGPRLAGYWQEIKGGRESRLNTTTTIVSMCRAGASGSKPVIHCNNVIALPTTAVFPQGHHFGMRIGLGANTERQLDVGLERGTRKI